MIVDNRYRVVSIEALSNSLNIRWGDDHVSQFPNIWLYEACQCEICGSSETAVRHISLRDKPEHPKIVACRDQSGTLQIYSRIHTGDT